jgi:hypothetical protein
MKMKIRETLMEINLNLLSLNMMPLAASTAISVFIQFLHFISESVSNLEFGMTAISSEQAKKYLSA